MKDSNDFKVGDVIVKFGEVCKIVSIEVKKDSNGVIEEVLHYKPFYDESRGNGVTYSIPVKNISLTSIRKPISQKELKSLIKKLSVTIKVDVSANIFEYQDAFNSNDPHEIADTLKKIWVEKQEKESELSKAKSDLFKASMKILVEEVAYLKNTTVSEAEIIITKALKN